MKDYTKYDFSAIVGAEVELQVKFFGCHKGKVLCRWEYEGEPYLTILVCKPEGNHLSDIPVDEIVPGSLSAKIKVADMSLKQLKRVLDEDVYNSVVFSRDENVIYEQMEIASELSGDYIERNYHDYIDCTDWGWKE